jgi:hypothetical protein
VPSIPTGALSTQRPCRWPGIMWSTAPLESPWFVDFDGVAPHNRALRIIRKDAQHLGESAARGVERLLVQKQVDASGLELTQKGDEVL